MSKSYHNPLNPKPRDLTERVRFVMRDVRDWNHTAPQMTWGVIAALIGGFLVASLFVGSVSYYVGWSNRGAAFEVEVRRARETAVAKAEARNAELARDLETMRTQLASEEAARMEADLRAERALGELTDDERAAIALPVDVVKELNR